MDFNPKIPVVETPHGIGSGVLSSIWVDKKKLPTVRGAQILLAYAQRGIGTLTAIPINNIVSVLSISFSLLLFSGFLLLLQNVGKFITTAGSNLSVTAYIKENASEDEVEKLLSRLRNDSGIKSLKYIDKASALKSLIDQFGSGAGYLAGLEDSNPLPRSFDMVLHPDELKSGRIERIIESIKEDSSVEDVLFGTQYVAKIQAVFRVFRFIAIATLMITLTVVALLIANTIRLAIYARRSEIEIMQLVGASDSFIKIPFVLGGILQGFIGATASLFFLHIAFITVSNYLRDFTSLSGVIPSFSFLPLSSIIGVIFLGIAVGAVGSYLALSRFMRV